VSQQQDEPFNLSSLDLSSSGELNQKPPSEPEVLMLTLHKYITPRGAPLFSLIVVVALFATACSKSQTAAVEAPPAFQPSPVAETAVKVPTVVAPKLTEVNDAVQRIFKTAAIIDTSAQPNFVAGDFNGDATQDIAIVIKPAPGKLSEMNEQYPSWLLRDALMPGMQRSGVLRVNDNETLLAIIHGYGPNDWRDPQATQTFLLKNAVGSDLQTQASRDVVKANKGKRLPPVLGDFIAETIRGTQGYIYYSVKTYAWFDPKTYKGEPAAGVVHPIMARR
jgi:hypothetical protein